MLDFHRELLSDEHRTSAYRAAIRSVVTPDSVVVDIGSGSGILAFFACEAGARRVFAIEKEHSADFVSLVARRLGYADRVEVLHEHSTKVELPEPATVLVTELLGTFGFEECIVSSVIDARRRFLAPDATIIPRDVALHMVPVELPDAYARHVAWWSGARYGFDFSPLRVCAANRTYILDVAASAHLAQPQLTMLADLRTVNDTNLSGTAQFRATRDGLAHGFAGWFRATLADGIVLTNDTPAATHWHQAFLPLEDPAPLREGDAVELTLETQDGSGWRWRGAVGGKAFDQTTYFGMPPCKAKR